MFGSQRQNHHKSEISYVYLNCVSDPSILLMKLIHLVLVFQYVICYITFIGQIDDNSSPCIFLCIHNSNVVLPPTKENIMHVGYSAGISYFKS